MALDAHRLQLLHIAVDHGKELQRVKLPALTGHLEMQEVAAPGNLLPGIHGHAIGDIRLSDMTVLHIELTIPGDNIVLMNGIRTDADHRSCRQGKQRLVVSGKVHSTVNERLARHGVLLLPEAETHLYLFLLRCLEGHHESAGGLQ